MKQEAKMQEAQLKQNFTRNEVDEIVGKVKEDKERKYKRTIIILASIMTLLGVIAILAILL